MQITLENLPGLERKLNIVVPAQRVEKNVQTKLQKLASTAKISGFRPGKVPLSIIQQRYGGSIIAEVIENLMRETYVEALRQENLKPAGMPKIEVLSAKLKEPFSYSAAFEVYPAVHLADLSCIQAEKTTSKLTDNDIDDAINKLRTEHVQWQKIVDPQRKSQVGDQIIVDFTVKTVSSPSAETSIEKDVKFVLGSGSMWPDFEKPLYEMSIGEKKSYTLQFPKTHVEENLAGTTAEFTVEIHGICEPILPSLDDEFAKKLGIKENGLEGLKQEVRKNLERELQIILKNSFKHSVLDKLLDNNKLEIPKVLVEKELDRLAEYWQERFVSQKQTSKQIPEFPRKEHEKQAQRSVSLGLLLATIIEENKIQVEEQELRDKIADLVSVYDDADKAMNWYFSDDKRLAAIRSLLLEEKAINYIASKAQILEKEVDYKEVVAKK